MICRLGHRQCQPPPNLGSNEPPPIRELTLAQPKRDASRTQAALIE